jgi:hypothetical protein
VRSLPGLARMPAVSQYRHHHAYSVASPRYARESAAEIEDAVGLTMQEWALLDGDFDPLEAAAMGM